MPSRPAQPAPTHGTDATAARLKDVALTGAHPYKITGMTAYSSHSPSHAWAVFSLTRGAVVAYIDGTDQDVQWFRDPDEAHERFIDIGREQLRRKRAEEVARGRAG